MTPATFILFFLLGVIAFICLYILLLVLTVVYLEGMLNESGMAGLLIGRSFRVSYLQISCTTLGENKGVVG